MFGINILSEIKKVGLNEYTYDVDKMREAVKYFEDGFKCNDITFVTDNSDKSPGFKFAESEVKGYYY